MYPNESRQRVVVYRSARVTLTHLTNHCSLCLDIFASFSVLHQKPVMILGTHELQGKVESLKQPFCVLEKEEASGGTSYRVGGIVTQKLLFDKYPKVILR